AEGRAVERVAYAPPDAAAPDADAIERRDSLQRAIASLAEEEREAIALRFGADLTVPEMAELLGQPLTTMEGRVYRALRKLRERL
ncbi:MAG: RNA polymerase sigma factor, partial [Solirubrobacteraceae bacterium]